MREDAWLGGRLGRPALTWEAGDDPHVVASAARERSPAFAQAKVAGDDVAQVAALERAGFGVVDVNITLEREAGPLEGGAGVEVGDARPEQRHALLELAERHFTVSRFHLDPGVPDAVARAIKRDWLAAYLDGERGERLLVALAGGEVAGFLGVLPGDGGGGKVIDIVAVHPDRRRAGAGRALVAALAGDRIVVGTQVSNIGSLRFYASLGFVVVQTRYILHLHA